MARIVGLHQRKLFRIRDDSGMFQCWIDFAIYTEVDESEMKTPWFGRVSGDFESGI